MAELFDFLRGLKKGISKQAYIIFVLLGAFLVYQNQQTPEQSKSFMEAVGYCFMASGLIIGVATSLISIKLEVYEHIIKQYREVADMNFATVKEDRKHFSSSDRGDTYENRTSSDITGDKKQKPQTGENTKTPL